MRFFSFNNTIRVPVIFLFFLLIFNSCTSDKETAENYYNRVVDEQQAVLEKEDRFIQLVNQEYMNAGKDNNDTISHTVRVPDKFGLIDKVYFDFCTQINHSLNALNGMKAYNENTGLKDATISLLEQYKLLAEKEYREIYQRIRSSKAFDSEENKARLEELIHRSDMFLQKKTDTFVLACNVFAREFGFEIVN
jgi:hypothetical protein